MQESIFNLIPQHEQYSAGLRKRAMVAEHVSVHTARDLANGAVSFMPPSSQPLQQDDPPMTSAGRSAVATLPSHPPYQTAASQRPPVKHSGIPRAAVQELDAAEVARRRQLVHMGGGAMAAALTPDETYQQRMLKSKQLKDHSVENRTKLKEQSIINGLLKAQGEVPQTRPAARKPEFTGRPKQSLDPGESNYVEANKVRVNEHAAKIATTSAAKPKPVKYTGPPATRPAGRIPKYLVERKIEMEVDKAMAEDAERRKHAGPAVMPEEERVATLEELHKQKDAAHKELNMIPPSKHQLLANKALIAKLESKLTEIDKAIILFSRKVVYVQ